MPGICGIIGPVTRCVGDNALDVMLQSMVHESFDRSGQFSHNPLNVRVGWTYHEGSFAERMPVWNERKDVCLIFSGEDFSDQFEIQGLKARGHEFEPEDSSYLVHLYEETGSSFFGRLNGWFCGVLLDLRKREVVLFNDRYGVNRIYYYEEEHNFYFASEAKTLLKILPKLRKVDDRSLGEFFACGSVLQDRTLFKGVRALPGGSAITFSPAGQTHWTTYFQSRTWEQQSVLSSSEFYTKLRDAWAKILPRYLRCRQKLALSLTGGVDSRMILAWAGCPPGALPCYTFGGQYRDSADVRISRQIAEICKQPHRTIKVGDEFVSKFPELAEAAVYLSDGAMDVTGALDLYVQRLARQCAPVRLSGVYGGEVLRRLMVFKPEASNYEYLNESLRGLVREAAATYAAELECHRLSFSAFKQAPWHMTAKFAIERSQVTFRTPYFDNELVALAYQAPPEAVDSNECSLRLIAEANPALGAVETDRGRALGAASGFGWARHAWHELLYRVEYHYSQGMPQWLARLDHGFAGLRLERLFLGRHKVDHFRVWYRDGLSRYLKDVLLDSRTLARPYFCRPVLERMVLEHTNGSRNFTPELSKILTSELLQRKLIDEQ